MLKRAQIKVIQKQTKRNRISFGKKHFGYLVAGNLIHYLQSGTVQ